MIRGFMDRKAAELPEMPFTSHRILGRASASSPFWREVRRHGEPLDLKEGTFFQPLEAAFFYCIESGQLRCDYLLESGEERSLLIFEAGALVNLEQAALGVASTFSFWVSTTARLWKLPGSMLEENISDSPHLVQECVRMFSIMSLTYQAALTWLGMDDFKIRFCRYLALNIRKFGTPIFKLGLTQAECANTLGVHRSTLARAVQALKKDGMLKEFTRDRVVIANPAALYELCGQSGAGD